MKYCRNGRPLIPSIADTCDYIDGSALRRLIANASNRVKAFMAHSVRKQRARDLYMDGDFEEIWKLFSTNFFLNRNILFSFFPFTKHDYSLVRNSFPLCYFFFFFVTHEFEEFHLCFSRFVLSLRAKRTFFTNLGRILAKHGARQISITVRAGSRKINIPWIGPTFFDSSWADLSKVRAHIRRPRVHIV